MNILKLHCFQSSSEICQLVSPIDSIKLDNPFDGTFQLKIVNDSNKDCQVSVQLASESPPALWEKLTLRVSSEEKLHFSGQVQQLLQEQRSVGEIQAMQELVVLFDFDLLALLLLEQLVQLEFSLLTNFSCQPSFSLNTSGQSQDEAAVLVQGASSEVKSGAMQPTSNTTSHAWLLYIASSLFVILFFVIMKYIHGKKKEIT